MAKLEIKVMVSGREIERASLPWRLSRGRIAVKYNGKLVPVSNGCIELEPAGRVEDSAQVAYTDGLLSWEDIVSRVLPSPLAFDDTANADSLFLNLRAALPSTVRDVSALLVAIEQEPKARDLIVAFLACSKGSVRRRKLLSMRLLFDQRRKSSSINEIDPLQHVSETSDVLSTAIPLDDSSWNIQFEEGSFGGGFKPEAETDTPEIDDRELRTRAGKLQQSISEFRPSESGAEIPDLGTMMSITLAETPQSDREPESVTGLITPPDDVLLERIVALGPALELLRYFSNNPGDHSFHAHQILDWPLPEINKLLSGTLSHYVSRCSEGGWECRPWVNTVMLELERRGV
ncbi:MAG: hypothetical protein ACRBBM_05185 [Pseudomonadaceae bacterium]